MGQSEIIAERKGKSNFDSEFCGNIPLNFINLIQPHGALIVLKKDNLTVVQVSENCNEVLDINVNDILQKKLVEFIGDDQELELIKRLEQLDFSTQVPLNISFRSGKGIITSTCIIHNKEGYAILEVEKEKPVEGNKTFTNLHQIIKFILVKLKAAATVDELARIAADEIKALSAFDRVMIYKFDEDWNGTVIAESKEDDMAPYLHLRFPASDIPKQARELYLKNPYRLIPDRAAKPSRLFPVMNPITRAFTDLSECNLRFIPAVHIEYLKNMNVVTSFSAPVIKNGELWGLISCHHKEAKYLSYEMLSAFELVADIIAAQLVARETEEVLENKNELVTINAKLLEKIYGEDFDTENLLSGNPNITDLLELDGVAWISEGSIASKGRTPSSEEIENLAKWLIRRGGDDVFTTDSLPLIYADGEKIKEVAAGLIAIPINLGKGSYFLGFRPEVAFTVDWGGNPYEAINMEKDGKTYHPRNSFVKWQEIVKNTSRPWTLPQLEAARTLQANVRKKGASIADL